MRRLVAIIAVLGLVATAGVREVERATACSLIGPLSDVPSLVQHAEVVAVGTITGTAGPIAELTVSEGIKGTRAGDVLTINNRELALGGDCSVVIEGPPPGHQRFERGERVLVALQQEDLGTGAKYRPSYFGFAVFRLDRDTALGDWQRETYAPLADVLGAISAAPASPPYDFERTRPCNPRETVGPAAVTTFAMHSQVAVRGTFLEAGPDVARFAVHAVLRGELAERTIRINNRWLSPPTDGLTCDVIQQDYPRFVAGGDVLLFLVPDEFGLADWRVALWTWAALGVGDGKVGRYPGPPTLSRFREAAGLPSLPPVPNRIGQPADPTVAPRPRDPVPSVPAPGGETDRTWVYVGVGIAVLLLAGVAIAAGWRPRR